MRATCVYMYPHMQASRYIDTHIVWHLFGRKVALNRAYSCLPSAAFDREQMNECTQDFLLQYVGLHKLAAAQGEYRWGLKPKSHMMAELAFATFTSPTTFWTYRDRLRWVRGADG